MSQQSFRLHSGDADFNNRVDTLFSSLQSAAKDLEPQVKRKHEEDLEEEEEEDEVRERSHFRQPQGRPPQLRGRRKFVQGRGGPRNNTPDYIKNPHNWTRYNMRDTPVLSDSENRREGLKLLADLDARSDNRMECQEKEEEEEGKEHHKIVFRKPISTTTTTTTTTAAAAESDNSEPTNMEEGAEEMESGNAEFGGSKKFVMQEYVVGQKKGKAKGKVGSEKQSTKNREVKLSYLMFEEED